MLRRNLLTNVNGGGGVKIDRVVTLAGFTNVAGGIQLQNCALTYKESSTDTSVWYTHEPYFSLQVDNGNKELLSSSYHKNGNYNYNNYNIYDEIDEEINIQTNSSVKLQIADEGFIPVYLTIQSTSQIPFFEGSLDLNVLKDLNNTSLNYDDETFKCYVYIEPNYVLSKFIDSSESGTLILQDRDTLYGIQCPLSVILAVVEYSNGTVELNVIFTWYVVK